MKPWKINITPFVLITVFSVISFEVGWTVATRGLSAQPFIPQTVTQRTITPQTIDHRQLSAAKDLKGTWEGVVNARQNPYSGGRYCEWKQKITLTIASQTGNTITGTMTFNTLSANGVGGVTCATGTTTLGFTANIAGSRIDNFTVGPDVFSGSFTQDTITLTQTNNPGSYMVGSLHLLRQ